MCNPTGVIINWVEVRLKSATIELTGPTFSKKDLFLDLNLKNQPSNHQYRTYRKTDRKVPLKEPTKYSCLGKGGSWNKLSFFQLFWA